MQHGAVLSSVYVLAGKHCINLLTQVGALSQVQQQLQAMGYWHWFLTVLQGTTNSTHTVMHVGCASPWQ